MTKGSYRDCYFNFDNQTLRIGNDGIEKKMRLCRDGLQTVGVLNRKTGFSWQDDGRQLPPPSDAPAEAECRVDDLGGLSDTHLMASLSFRSGNCAVRLELRVFPQIPFIMQRSFFRGGAAISASPDKVSLPQETSGIESEPVRVTDTVNRGCIDRIALPSRHLKRETVLLMDQTDQHDVLTREWQGPVSCIGKTSDEGSMLVLDDYLHKEKLMLVREAPTPQCALNRNGPGFIIRPGQWVEINGCGIDFSQLSAVDETPAYGVTVGIGADCRREFKKFYKSCCKARPSFLMSNTWGDRNRDGAVCAAFLMKEIDAAARIGVDCVQIDDGWQKGKTANSSFASGGAWGNYYAADRHFWDFDPEKFPDGFGAVAAYASAHGVKLALWFSPDSTNDYENWERDSDCMLRLHREYGICFFKLDGVQINSKASERHYTAMLARTSRESGNKVDFNLDITAQKRFGYLYERQFGTIFVENRYTDWGNYYPHDTFKNLWCLCRLMPPDRFQFEVLNNRRNPEKYSDAFAPENYSLDYLFASVMVSNPLLWMELSRLSPEDMDTLAAVVAVYRRHRDSFRNAEILPIGQMPDGCSFTGFQIIVSASRGYLLLFREFTERAEYVFQTELPEKDGIRMKLLYASAGADSVRLRKERGAVRAVLREPRSFVFAAYELSQAQADGFPSS